MKKNMFFLVVVFLVITGFLTGSAAAQDHDFAESKQDIINGLTAPKTRSLGQSRSFTPKALKKSAPSW